MQTKSLFAVKLVFWNIVVAICLMVLVEIALGYWLVEKPQASYIPAAQWSKTLTYDVSKLYGSDSPVYVTYTRDARGYRGDFSYHAPLVLTIGGSTTDQRYVGDSDTWQSIIQEKLGRSAHVINGGVDGQSTFGHLFAVRNWHSLDLRSHDIRMVVFYVGVNDERLLFRGSSGLNRYDKTSFFEAPIDRLLREVYQNSFFYRTAKEIERKYVSQTKNDASHRVLWPGHSKRSGPFERVGKYYKIPSAREQAGFDFYLDLVIELVRVTRSVFPGAKIMLVQQQVPGCKFTEVGKVYDRHPNSENESYSPCLGLGQVYEAQLFAVSRLAAHERPRVLQMFLEDVISDDGVYDTVHTNPKGSREIGDWLAPIIERELSGI